MVYNFIREMYNGTFSLKRDYDETFKRLEAWGLDKILIDTPGRVLGTLNNLRDRRLVQECYLLGTYLGLASVASVITGELNTAKIAAMGGLVTAIFGAVHHNARSNNEQPPNNHRTKDQTNFT
ncbi:hypothetical protein HYV88_02735 [Candidatus Woesearchaeota archaeon]|nr:hypothetical protein [Candidatus Woesearchaeota archaeon]